MLRAQRITKAILVGACLWLGTTRSEVRADPPAETTLELGQSVEGRPIECQILGQGEDVLMIIATIHGDESAGTPLVEAFRQWLREHPEELAERQVIIIPVANPDGLAAGTRFNAQGIDLNRNFAAGNWQRSKLHGATPLSEPESRALMRAICQFFPDRVISIHQPVACIDYDGPARELAEALGATCPLPVQRIGSRPGSLGSFVGETLHRPIITLELPEEAELDRTELFRDYGDLLRAALRFAPQR